MIRFLTPAVGFFHSLAIEDRRPVGTYVAGYMGITTPIMISAAHTIGKKELARSPFGAAILAGTVVNGALYGMGRTIGHIVGSH